MNPNAPAANPTPAQPWRGIIREFRTILPPIPEEAVVTLLEGNTPLVPAPRLAARIAPGLSLHLKIEGQNPTGSFKDRGMTVAVSRAVAAGAKAVLCASTGNTSASAAAYAARRGLRCVVVIPGGQIALGKLAQAMIYGARVVAVEGNFDHALELVRALSDEGAVCVVNSINPDRIEGQASAAREIVEQLGGPPDTLALPYGGGGNTCAYARGFGEAGAGMPRLLAVETAERAETFASAIRIVEPVHREQAEAAAEVVTVTDGEILDWWRAIARQEGIFCEPASAAGVAGVAQIRPGGRVVCVLTGHGLKDPDAAERL